nr:MAG: hypothetical protein DIU78_26465 [Pseudomonadota bacterium]
MRPRGTSSGVPPFNAISTGAGAYTAIDADFEEEFASGARACPSQPPSVRHREHERGSPTTASGTTRESTSSSGRERLKSRLAGGPAHADGPVKEPEGHVLHARFPKKRNAE